MNATTDIIAPKISWQISLFLFAAVLLLAVPQAALLPLLDRDEPRFAEAAREMIQSGNFVVPTFNGAPRYDKPPLIYWCEALAYELFGESAFTARLPALIATAATAVLIYTWGTRLGSDQVGLAAGLSYAFCLQTIQQGRVATADALLIFFMTLTAFAGWMSLRPKKADGVPLACYGVLVFGIAGGFLAKGPEALLPLIPLLWFGRGARFGVTCSLLLGLALVLLWALPAYIETNGDFWWRSFKAGIGDRIFGADQGHGTSNLGLYLLELPYYFVLFWLSALPWSPLLALHAKKLITGWRLDDTDRYLLLNIVLTFAVFTLMATKLPHYTLPVFPLIALLLVRRWKSVGLSPGFFTELGWIAGGLISLLTLVAIPIALAHGLTPSPTSDLVRAAGDEFKPDTPFALVDFKEPTTVWEMRRVTKADAQLIDSESVASFLDQPGSRAVMLSTDLWQRFHLVHATSQPQWKVYEARGFNAAKGNFIDLTLVVKP